MKEHQVIGAFYLARGPSVYKCALFVKGIGHGDDGRLVATAKQSETWKALYETAMNPNWLQKITTK